MTKKNESNKNEQLQNQILFNRRLCPQLFKSIEWSLLASYKSKLNYLCNIIAVEKDSIVGTDRKKLHLTYMNNVVIPTGIYCITKINSEEVWLVRQDTKYPNWKEIIPNYENYNSFVAHSPLEFCYGCFLNHIAINHQFIEKLFQFEEKFRVYLNPDSNITPIFCKTVDSSPKLNPIPTHIALIMPITLDKIEFTIPKNKKTKK